MSEKLKPCPFCGDTPELPSGDGTQYEIECGGCGQAMTSVQICDLMTLEERASETFTNYRYGEQFIERAKLEAIERWNTRIVAALQAKAVVLPELWQSAVNNVAGYAHLYSSGYGIISEIRAEHARLNGNGGDV